MVFLPSPITSTADPFLTHVHSDFYEKARKYVEGGGFLYASVAADGAIPDMASLFGARLADRVTNSEVTLKFVAPFGDFKVGDTLHYNLPDATISSWGTLLDVTTAKVIAVDQNGHPALVTNTLGSGKTLLSAYPVEHYLAAVPGVFDKPEDTHRIYAAFRQWTGVKPGFLANSPSVEVTVLKGEHRGYIVVVNHSAEAQNVSISTTLAPHSLARITPAGSDPIPLDESHWKMKLEPYEGTIVAWN
jgi:hypothetical protein